MKALRHLTAILALPALFAACQTNDPLYDSHWNVGSLGDRASYHLLGYDDNRGQTILEHEQEAAESIALSFRRHILNDNPTNPMQMRRGWGGDSPYDVTSLYADVYYIGREAVVTGVRTATTAVLLPIDLVVGPVVAHAGIEWEGAQGLVDYDGDDPTPPEDFEVRNRR